MRYYAAQIQEEWLVAHTTASRRRNLPIRNDRGMAGVGDKELAAAKHSGSGKRALCRYADVPVAVLGTFVLCCSVRLGMFDLCHLLVLSRLHDPGLSTFGQEQSLLAFDRDSRLRQVIPRTSLDSFWSAHMSMNTTTTISTEDRYSKGSSTKCSAHRRTAQASLRPMNTAATTMERMPSTQKSNRMKDGNFRTHNTTTGDTYTGRSGTSATT